MLDMVLEAIHAVMEHIGTQLVDNNNIYQVSLDTMLDNDPFGD